MEPDLNMYIRHLVEIFREVKRVLRDDGSMYIVMGDTYYGGKGKSGAPKPEKDDARYQAGETLQRGEYDLGMETRPQDRSSNFYKPKCLLGIPWRLAFALIEDGWILRNDLIWKKENCMPQSIKDRFTNTYEHIFMFVLSQKYYFDLDAVRRPHKTLSLERYQRAVNQKAGLGKPYEGKYQGLEKEVTEFGGMQRQALLEGVSVNAPQWFEEIVQPDKNYKGKFDQMVERGANTGENNKEPYRDNNPHRSRLEQAKLDDSTQIATRTKLDKEYKSRDPERHINIKGANPGDVIQAEARDRPLEAPHHKFRGEGWEKQAIEGRKPRKNDDTGYGTDGSGIREHKGNSLNHPLGANPGDVVFADDRGKLGAERQVMEESGYVNQHSGYMLAGLKIKAQMGLDIRNPLGKNPGDVIQSKFKEEDTEAFGSPYAHIDREGKDIYKKDYHPQGANPGDIITERVESNLEHFSSKGSGGHYAYGELDSPEGSHQHSAGANPGDVMLSRHHGSGPQYKLSGLKRGWKYTKNPQPEDRSHTRMGGELTQVPEDNLHPLGRNPGDTVEAEGEAGDFVSVNTRSFKGAHFSVFPPDLVEPFIKAATSEAGNCAKCGKSWVRVTKRLNKSTYKKIKDQTGYDYKNSLPLAQEQGVALSGGNPSIGNTRNPDGSIAWYASPETVTLGWEASCQCCRKCDIMGLQPNERRLAHAIQRPRNGETISSEMEESQILERRGMAEEAVFTKTEIPQDMPLLPKGIYGQGDQPILQSDLLNEMDVAEQSGEPLFVNEAGEQISIQTEAGQDSKSSPYSNGEAFGQTLSPQRVSPSYQRGQERQSVGELNYPNETNTCLKSHKPSPQHDLEPYPIEPAVVLDPFSGSGTVGLVARKMGRKAILIDLVLKYCEIAKRRIEALPLPLAIMKKEDR